jgi:hypothetical protein
MGNNNKFYNIHLENEIHKRIIDQNVLVKYLMIVFRYSKNTIHRMYQCTYLKVDYLFKWCIVLENNFFELLKNEYSESKSNIKSI